MCPKLKCRGPADASCPQPPKFFVSTPVHLIQTNALSGYLFVQINPYSFVIIVSLRAPLQLGPCNIGLNAPS